MSAPYHPTWPTPDLALRQGDLAAPNRDSVDLLRRAFDLVWGEPVEAEINRKHQ